MSCWEMLHLQVFGERIALTLLDRQGGKGWGASSNAPQVVVRSRREKQVKWKKGWSTFNVKMQQQGGDTQGAVGIGSDAQGPL